MIFTVSKVRRLVLDVLKPHQPTMLTLADKLLWLAGVVIVADGTERADRCLARVLWNDPAMGVFRHADAGYEIAQEHAQKIGLHSPMTH